MPILRRLKHVESHDGVPRVKVVWGKRRWVHFADVHELRELARDVLIAIKELGARSE